MELSPVKLYHFIYPGGHYVEHQAPDGQYTQQTCDEHYMEVSNGHCLEVPKGQHLECSSSSDTSHSASGYYSNCHSVSSGYPIVDQLSWLMLFFYSIQMMMMKLVTIGNTSQGYILVKIVQYCLVNFLMLIICCYRQPCHSRQPKKVCYCRD